MEAAEFRTGNLIYSRDGSIKVIDVINATTNKLEFDDSDDDYSIYDCNPIPLTDDLFDKFGFKKGYSEYHKLNYWWMTGFKFLIRDQGNGEYTPCTHANFLYSAAPRFKYVHKLQNFYHAFKDEELILNNN